MRKLLSVLFSTLQDGVRRGLLFLLFFASVSAIYASDTQVDGIWYDFDSSTKTASATYRGSAYDSYEGEYSGSVVIPETVTYNGTTYSVTSIGESAFEGCSSLTSVTIGESVTSIGGWAFQYCFSLTSITIPNSVTSIGDYAFCFCSSLTSITIPNSVTSIGYDAFYYCSSLTSVTIGNSVTSIGSSAFEDCTSLTSITIPESVTSIESSAFEGCSSLTSVTIGNSVTSIGSSAFEDCSSLTSVTIGESVTSIGDDAFQYCSSLTSITIPKSVTSIGSSTFIGCYFLKENFINNSSLDAEANNYWDATFVDIEIDGLLIRDNTIIRCRPYVISATIPDNVTSIGDDAFWGCSSLTSVTIGDGVTSIGDYAFSGCSSLTSVTIGKSVTSIGESAFWGCSSLPVENNLRYADTYLVEAVNKTLSTYSIKEGTKWVGDNAFYNCSSLTSITIPNSVTSIGDGAFCDCTSLTAVTIPNSVISIGGYAFYGCSSLTSITCEAETPPTVGSDAFYKVSKSIPVYVPCGCVEAYKTASSWKNFTNIQEPLVKYSIEVNVNDTNGTAKVDRNSACDNQISATPNYGYHFVQWSDGVTDNPRTLTLTQDTILTAEFAINQYTISTASSHKERGTTAGDTVVDYLEYVTISATANYGYHFVQWNDGNTENPRTLELTQDTILTAEFAQSFSGQCGDNLYWSYDEDTKTISITGSGKMYDYTADTQPWLLFKEQIKEVTTTNTVTSIGTSAFEGCARLSKVSLGTGLEEIAANAFAGCTRLYDIYVYATYPPFAEESSFANYNVYVYIPCEYQKDYTLDVVWGKFKFIECIESEDVTTDGVLITPSTNDVTITWPTEGNADTYTIVIKKGNEVFCTLTFNAEGQLLNIAFAPGRNGNHPVQYAEQAGNGYRFTVTGLEEGTHYAYNIDVKDAADKTIKSYTGEFTTQTATSVENTNIHSPITNCQKIIRNGQLLILRDGVEYTVMGAEIK